ncbi:MAG: low temperature requirement protein A [Actinobacteria bacterium]|nr:low temperature requirement protein A [Actinomycetota bacterium]
MNPMRPIKTSPQLRAQPGDNVEIASSFIELFFDLVFVFAVTQLSNHLLGHLDLRGVAQTTFLLMVLWWAWIYTTWTTNWMDPDLPLVRLMLMASMLCGLLMAVAIPDAFGDRALLFAGAYVALQLIVNGFKLVATPEGHEFQPIFARIFIWYVWVSALWIAGALAGGDALYVIWAIALVADYAGPYYRYWNPWHGNAETTEWRITPSHFVERFQLFVIIALGESVVVTGAATANAGLDTESLLALVGAFVFTATMWWLYFDEVAVYALRHMNRAEDPGRLGRDAYTYGHIPIIAGIIVSAVGDKLVIEDPANTLATAELLVVFGGPMLYLAGHTVFRWAMIRSVSRKRVLAIAALGAFAVVAWLVEIRADASAAITTAVLVLLAIWEYRPSEKREERYRETILAAKGP